MYFDVGCGGLKQGEHMSKRKVANSRRGFLISIGAGTVASAAAVVGAVTPGADGGHETERREGESGYRVSEHINKYYRTTRV